MATLFELSARSISGAEVPLREYAGKVVLVVNVASKCGFTPQYKGLELLYERFRDRGFVVLGFPCNQFMAQEPGDEAEIQSFCSRTYDVSFPMFAKVNVNGSDVHPVYVFLKNALPGLLWTTSVKWNFTKFLVGRDGLPVARYSPTTSPESLADDIEKLLGPASN